MRATFIFLFLFIVILFPGGHVFGQNKNIRWKLIWHAKWALNFYRKTITGNCRSLVHSTPKPQAGWQPPPKLKSMEVFLYR